MWLTKVSYATAKDEFEIAAEETEKMTVYAEDDRAAAREELTKLQNAYKAVVEGHDKQLATEIQRRVGQLRFSAMENRDFETARSNLTPMLNQPLWPVNMSQESTNCDCLTLLEGRCTLWHGVPSHSLRIPI